MNPFDIRVPCINIAKSGILFEQYRMALYGDKYYIKVRNDDAIKCNRIFFILCNKGSIVWIDYIYVKDVF